MRYDYKKNIMEDVENYITLEEQDAVDLLIKKDLSFYDFGSYLKDVLWTADDVTGNGSKSYTYDRAKAEENLTGNLHLYAAAATEFGTGRDAILDDMENPEAMDVAIRCFLLDDCINQVVSELKNTVNIIHDSSPQTFEKDLKEVMKSPVFKNDVLNACQKLLLNFNDEEKQKIKETVFRNCNDEKKMRTRLNSLINKSQKKEIERSL